MSAKSPELTDKQGAFVDLVVTGHSPERAVALAGYTGKPAVVAWKLMRSQAVQFALRERHIHQVEADLMPLASKTLRRLMEDDTVPPAVALGAAKHVTSLYFGQAGPMHEDDSRRELVEMSAAELQRAAAESRKQLATLQAMLRSGQQHAIEAEYVDVAPDDTPDDGAELLD